MKKLILQNNTKCSINYMTIHRLHGLAYFFFHFDASVLNFIILTLPDSTN